MGRAAPRPRGRRRQGPPREGRQPRDGAASTPSSTVGCRRRTRARPRSTPTTSACVDARSAPGPRRGLRVGIASHNLFDVAWALLVARDHGVAERIEIEMLQGMRPPQARVVRDASGGLAPVLPRRHRQGLRRGDQLPVPPPRGEHRARELPAPRLLLARGLAAVRRGGRPLPHGGGRAPRRVTPGCGGRRPSRPMPTSTTSPTAIPRCSRRSAGSPRSRDLPVQPARAAVTTEPAEVDDVYARARAAQPGWWALGAEVRRATLDRVAGELAARGAGSSSPRWRRRPPRSTPRVTPR